MKIDCIIALVSTKDENPTDGKNHQVEDKTSTSDDKNFEISELKKFYQVVFLNKDDNKVIIYTGVVVPEPGLVISFQEKNQANIEHTCITNDFCKDTNGWTSVWGKEGLEIHSDNFDPLMKEHFNSVSHKKDIAYLNSLSLFDELILIHDDREGFKSLAVKTHHRKPNKSHNHYDISFDHSSKMKNVDYVNWTKSEIHLKDDTDWKLINYGFKFSKFSNVRFSSNDFKIYFVLPEHYEISNETSRFGLKFWDDDKTEDRNAFQDMKTDASKYFDDWKTSQGIEYRNYYKAAGLRNVSETYREAFFEYRISSKKIKRASNWILTIITSLLIAYGLDHTRMTSDNIKPLFFLFPILEYIFLILLVIASKICLNQTNTIAKTLKIIFKLSYNLSVILFAYWLIIFFLRTGDFSNISEVIQRYTGTDIFVSEKLAKTFYCITIVINLIIVSRILYNDRKIRKYLIAIFKTANGSKKYS